MLLRSSSTPVLGSLLFSFSESPNNFENNNRPPSGSENLKKISFLHGTQPSFHSISHSIVGMSDLDRESGMGPRGFRRARSDGNLAGLTESDIDELHNPNPTRISRRPSSVLETIPSFSVYNSREDEEEEEEEEEEEIGLSRCVTIGENITSFGGDFCFSNGKMDLVEEELEGSEEILSMKGIESPLFLARGLGIDVGDLALDMNSSGGGCGGGGGFSWGDCNGCGDGSDMETYYKRMVEENPCDALFLRNYAQFLYQTKGDYHRAEEYYSRAILAEPGDGEILSQYAKLIWELHHDQERASSYFEQAVQAAPADCIVHAAYASFLWETEGEDEVGEVDLSQGFVGAPISYGAMASAST
ncbi:uncharacterized protein LOC143860788 [Tasmannia lanceolata]|uniref:uncharacterized protein LOC143860788 n=1 Tax=Tasmannia lanceolata TaxID=3420 RepID=UPI004064783B